MRHWIRTRGWGAILVVMGLALAIALRVSLLSFKSVDFFDYTRIWYNALKEEGFATFRRDFSNYNLPYLYLLYGIVRLWPDLPAVVAVKIPSLAADFVTAWFAFRLVNLRQPNSYMKWAAGFAVLMTPTVVLNSAFWGQADAIYACLLVASTYFLSMRKDSSAMATFGLALAFKAQAIFLLPLVGALLLRRDIRWRTLLWIPAILLAALVPALAAGRSFVDLLMIYPSQAGQYEQLSMHAPTALAWIPDGGRYFGYFSSAGLILAAAGSLAFAWAIHRSPSKIMPATLVELALISAILVPFLLPRMHERYFYLADVLSVIIAFLLPGGYVAPLLMVTISFFSYQPTLFGVEPVPMAALALGVLALLAVLLRHAWRQLYPVVPAIDGPSPQ